MANDAGTAWATDGKRGGLPPAPALLRQIGAGTTHARSPGDVLKAGLGILGGYLDWPLGLVRAPRSGDVAEPGPVVSVRFDGPPGIAAFRDTLLHAPPERDHLAAVAVRGTDPVWRPDLTEDRSAPVGMAARRSGIRCGLAIPAVQGGMVRAVLEFFHTEPQSLHPSLLERLQEASIELALLFRVAELEEAAAREGRALEWIREVHEDLAAAGLEIDAVLARIAHRARGLTGADGSAVELAEGDEMVYRAATGIVAEHVGLRLRIDGRLSGEAYRTGRILRSDDTESDPRVDREATRKIGARSMVLVPLRGPEGTAGVLKVLSARARAFAGRDVAVLRILTGLMGTALDRAKRYSEQGEVMRSLKAESRRRRAVSERLRAIIGASPLPVAALDGEGRVTLWSPAAAGLFGWQEDDILGRKAPFLIPPEEEEEPDREARRLLTEAAGKGGEIQNLELACRRRDGSPIQVRIRAAPVRNDRTGALRELVIVFEDITGAKRTEARLRHAERMEAIGRLAGGVAHDFNNMLTAVRGNADLLLGEENLPEEHRDAVREIRNAAERASYVTRQLLAYSRQEVRGKKIVDLNEVVGEVASLLRHLVEERISLVLQLDPDAGSVSADPGQLEQVLVNLVVNGRDAIEGAGRIEVETRRVELGDEAGEHLGGFEPGPYVRVTVRDDGSGIAPEHRARLFEPFYTTKAVDEGTGLGLATVDGIVHQSGGWIEVESEVGEGSAFHVYLPTTRPEVRGHGRDSEGEAWSVDAGGERATILLAEDERAVRRLVRRILERAGHRVREAATAKEALELITGDEEAPDLFLSDVVMPELSGPELARRFRERYPDIPVLFISGYARDDLTPAELGGKVHHLEKPFTPDGLVRAVEKILEE